jgi:hypothetical protein
MRPIHGLIGLLLTALTPSITSADENDVVEQNSRAKVTGIGGVFFLSSGDGKSLAALYEKHLGMHLGDFGAAG